MSVAAFGQAGGLPFAAALATLAFAFALDPVAPPLMLGLLARTGAFGAADALPAPLHACASLPFVVAAAVLWLAHGPIDKVPTVGHALDGLGVFLKPCAVALTGLVLIGAVGGDAPARWVVGGPLLAGAIVLVTTLQIARTKARLTFSGATAGFAHPLVSAVEGGLSLLLAWLAFTHPFVGLCLAVALVAAPLALVALLIGAILGLARSVFGRRRAPV
jgi:hypothetical protein